MMRGLVFLALISHGTAADATKGRTEMCTIDSVQATGATVQAVLDIWAATKRCTPEAQAMAPVFCEIDVAASIQSLANLAGAVAGMASQCGMIGKGVGAACGWQAQQLISLTAGLAKAGGKIDEWCGAVDKYPYDDATKSKYRYEQLPKETYLGKCVFNAGKSVEYLDTIYDSVKGIEKKCKGGGKWCAVGVMGVMRTISGFGAYLANAVSRCYMVDPDGWDTKKAYPDENGVHADAPMEKQDLKQAFLRPTNCAGAISVSIAYINGLANTGIQMQDKCKPPEGARLYLDNESDNSETASNLPTVLALAAAIPLAAVLSFIAGTKLSKSPRSTRQMMAVSEHDELLNVEE